MESVTTLLNSTVSLSDISSLNTTISTIDKYMQNLSTQIEESISVQYDDIEKAKEDTSMIYDNAKKTLHEFEHLNKSLTNDSNIEVQRTEEVEQSLMDKMLKSENMISILHKLCQAHEVLEEKDDSVEVTAKKLVNVNAQLSLLCNGDLTPKVVTILKKEVKGRMDDIMLDVENWDAQIDLCYAKVECSADCIEVLTSKVLTMKILSKAKVKEKAAVIATDFNKMILDPIILYRMKCQCEVSDYESTSWLSVIESDCGDVPEAESKCEIEFETSTTVLTLDEVMVAIAYLEDFVIPKDKLFQDEFYSIIYECFSKCIIETRLAKCVPTEVTQFAEYKKVEDAIKEFEDRLQVENIETSCAKFPNFDKRLSSFTSNVNLHFANQKRNSIYRHAREIMENGRLGLHEDSDNVSTIALNLVHEITNEDSFEMPEDPTSSLSLNIMKGDIFSLPEFQVSATAIKLSKLISQTLNLAMSPDITPAGADIFCRTIDNVLILYQIPALSPVQIGSSPEVSAQFYCDCVYLSDYLVTTSSLRIDKLPKDVNYIHHASNIMRLGLKTMEINAMELCRKIEILIEQTGGLAGAAKEDQSMVLEMAFIQVVDNLKTYTSDWKKVLPKEFYLNNLNNCINKTLSLICKETLSIEDMSASDSSRLYYLFTLLQDQFTKLKENDNESGEWKKFCLLTTMLDESLISIVGNWEAGVLPPYFRAAEVLGFTRALFQNTDKNAALRSKIKGDVV